MQPIHPHRPNIFAGSPLDRMDASRKDEALVAADLASSETLFLPVWRSLNFVSGTGADLRFATVSGDAVHAQLSRLPWAWLGRLDGRAHVAVDFSGLDDPLPSKQVGRFEDLRRVGSVLPASDASILAYARGLMHWRTRTRFCSVCGASCAPISAGHVMACEGCGAHHFPRSDPAVIMLVTHDGRALLGQPARFRETRIFTTLAGFVEPGETLEEAVAREVYEEAGVQVGNVRYRSSQPWPFPASIMLGFTAEAQDDRITIDPAELVSADWFTKDQLKSPKASSSPPTCR